MFTLLVSSFAVSKSFCSPFMSALSCVYAVMLMHIKTIAERSFVFMKSFVWLRFTVIILFAVAAKCS